MFFSGCFASVTSISSSQPSWILIPPRQTCSVFRSCPVPPAFSWVGAGGGGRGREGNMSDSLLTFTRCWVLSGLNWIPSWSPMCSALEGSGRVPSDAWPLLFLLILPLMSAPLTTMHCRVIISEPETIYAKFQPLGFIMWGGFQF